MIRVEWRAALIGAAIGVLTWFLPGLVGGSQAGILFGILWCRWLNAYGLQPREFALVGMAAFFGAVVRSPITGIILIVELTGAPNTFSQCWVPLLLP